LSLSLSGNSKFKVAFLGEKNVPFESIINPSSIILFSDLNLKKIILK